MKLSVLTVVVIIIIAISTAANLGIVAAAPEDKTETTPPAVKLPSAIVKGTVKAMRGSSFGYVPPTEGQEFELNLHPEGQTYPQLTFKGEGAYIPFPKPLSVDVDWNNNNSPPYWSSLRAVYKDEKRTHKVTLDVSRHPGFGDPEYVVAWVLIENNDRIIGVAELHGLVTKPKK